MRERGNRHLPSLALRVGVEAEPVARHFLLASSVRFAIVLPRTWGKRLKIGKRRRNMARSWGRCNCCWASSLAGWLIGGWVVMVSSKMLLAAPPALEHREFAILVDGNKAGNYDMAIRHAEDGTKVMTG